MSKTNQQRGKAAKCKGKSGELEVVHILREAGFEDARRTQQFSGQDGTSDVLGIPGYHLEVKRQETYRIDAWLEQAEHDAAEEGTIPVLIFRKSNQPWRVILSLDDFINLFPES